MDFYINRKKKFRRSFWSVELREIYKIIKKDRTEILFCNINILSLLSASLSHRLKQTCVSLNFQYDIWHKQAVSQENIKLDVSSVHWPNGGPTLFSQRQPYNPQPMLAKQSHAASGIISKYSLFECLLIYPLYKSAYFSYPSNNQNLHFL